MELQRVLNDRCLDVLDKLVRNAEHEMQGVSAELQALRRDQQRLSEALDGVAAQMRETLACIDRLQAAGKGIDLSAVARYRAWMPRLLAESDSTERQLGDVVQRIEPLLARLDALRRRQRVLQRARERRSDRLAQGRARRLQREADEQHLLRGLAGVVA